MLKPRVLHVINNLNVSGATVLLLDVVSYLRPAGGEVTVCALEPENPMAEALERAGARVVAPRHPMNVVTALAFVHKVIEQVEPAIVHTHLLPATQLGLIGARLSRKPAVTTVHFAFDLLTANIFLRWVNRVSYGFYDSIFAISNAVKQSILRNCSVPENRVKVLLSGVDFARAIGSGTRQGVRDEMRRRLGYADGDIVIGTIGRLDPVKGHHLLIDALVALRPRFSRARLLLVGDGQRRPKLERQAEAFGVRDVVNFAGSQKDPAGFLAAMDIFALPSTSEGLGLSIIEAMAAGLPVVGSTAGGIPEVVEDRKTGLLFASNNAKALAASLAELIREPELARVLAAAGKARAEQQFGIATYVGRLYEEYDRTLHPREHSAADHYAHPAPKEAAT